MHKSIAHHLPTDAQPVPEQQLPLHQPTLLFYTYFTLYHIALSIPLASLGQLSWFCHLPALCAPQLPSMVEQYEKLKS